MIVGAGTSKICQAGCRLEILSGVDGILLSSKARNSGQVSMLQSGRRTPSSSGLLKPSTDWRKPTDIMESNLLYPKSTGIKCYSHLNENNLT